MITSLVPALLCPAFMSFGFSEILLVAVVALLVFGGNLPDVMRQLGQSYGRLRRSLSDLSQPVRDELRQVRDLPSPEEMGSMPLPDPAYPEHDEPDRASIPDPLPPKPVAEPEAEGATGAADEPPPV